MNHNRQSLSVFGDVQNLEIIADFITQATQQSNLSEQDIFAIQLAVDEACTNVVQHAYKGMTPKDIDVFVEVDSKKLTITVSDHGRGFDPDSFPQLDMDAYLNELKRGGLGIYLIRTLMDEVKFTIAPGHKNSVRMAKFLHPVESMEKKLNQKILLEKSHERKREAVSK